LEGKLALVTGGSRGLDWDLSDSSSTGSWGLAGIGAAIARNLASKGASLVIGYNSDRSADITSKLAVELKQSHGINVLSVQADMGNPKGPQHVIDTTKNHFSHPRTGKFQIDIMVNNAAVSENLPLEEVTRENFTWQYTVNVLGPILLMQAALQSLVRIF